MRLDARLTKVEERIGFGGSERLYYLVCARSRAEHEALIASAKASGVVVDGDLIDPVPWSRPEAPPKPRWIGSGRLTPAEEEMSDRASSLRHSYVRARIDAERERHGHDAEELRAVDPTLAVLPDNELHALTLRCTTLDYLLSMNEGTWTLWHVPRSSESVHKADGLVS